MARVDVRGDATFAEPVLVEGMPGVGLVGKIVVDHLVETLDMEHYATCYCEGLPRVAVYNEGDRRVGQPVRIYADEQRDLLALQSDVPVSPEAAPEFAACLTGWFAERNVMPVFLSGLPEQNEELPSMYGIGTGRGAELLEEYDVAPPRESGIITGPTGALLAEACEQGVDAVGLVVEADEQFPDPEAARTLLVDAIEKLADIEVPTEKLVDRAEEIARAREQLARRMDEADDESTQARPLGMYQ